MLQASLSMLKCIKLCISKMDIFLMLDYRYELTVPVPREGGEGGYPRRTMLKLVHPITASHIDIIWSSYQHKKGAHQQNYIHLAGLAGLGPDRSGLPEIVRNWNLSEIDQNFKLRSEFGNNFIFIYFLEISPFSVFIVFSQLLCKRNWN